MNCEMAQERMVLSAYGELAGTPAEELEQHLAGCEACRRAQAGLLQVQQAADTYPVAEPDANLVARARMRLEDTLDALPERGWLARALASARQSFWQWSGAPLAASVMMAVGIAAGAAGGFTFARLGATHAAPAQNTAKETQESAPQTGNPAKVVEVAATHSAVKNAASLKQKSTGATATPAVSSSLEQLLLTSLRTDENPAARERALFGLQRYVAEDVQARNAVLEALLNDPSPRVRTAALNLLQPVEADTTVREVLHTVADSDQNPYIRNVSRQVLSQVPEIQ